MRQESREANRGRRRRCAGNIAGNTEQKKKRKEQKEKEKEKKR